MFSHVCTLARFRCGYSSKMYRWAWLSRWINDAKLDESHWTSTATTTEMHPIMGYLSMWMHKSNVCIYIYIYDGEACVPNFLTIFSVPRSNFRFFVVSSAAGDFFVDKNNFCVGAWPNSFFCWFLFGLGTSLQVPCFAKTYNLCVWVWPQAHFCLLKNVLLVCKHGRKRF